MKIKIIYNSRIPGLLSIFINIGAITLYPYIIYRNKEEEISETIKRHEMIHIIQQKELWVIGFYLLYVFYWLKNLMKGQNSSVAYYNIPFEIEAYKNQDNLDYLKNRPKHSWKQYRKDILVS